MKGSSILDHVPIEEAVHKENTIKAGPWNNNARKCPLISSAVKPSFKGKNLLYISNTCQKNTFILDCFIKYTYFKCLVHEDTDEINIDKLKLFPNHIAFYDDSKYDDCVVPVFVPDVPNQNIILKPQYPKDLVYANNEDRSLEQIKAQKYLEA